MVLISHHMLQELVTQILCASGSAQLEAGAVARHLVDANLCGHDSHGVGMLGLYLSSTRRGGLFFNRTPRLVSDFGAVLVFDGERGFGAPAACMVLDAAMARARQLGVALVTLRNSGHLGRIGAHGETLARAGFAALLLVNVVGRPPTVAPHGGTQARISSNPFCLAYPALDGQAPVVLDAATAGIAIGKARIAQQRGQALASGLMLDDRGAPTTDPGFALGAPHGALLPFGLHKGSGLGLFCELLAGALTGGQTAQPGNGNQDRMATANNLLAVVIDPRALAGTDTTQAEARAMLDYFRSARPVDPAHPVQAPGDLEAATRAQRLQHGITLDQPDWDSLLELAQAVGVAAPAVASTRQAT